MPPKLALRVIIAFDAYKDLLHGDRDSPAAQHAQAELDFQLRAMSHRETTQYYAAVAANRAALARAEEMIEWPNDDRQPHDRQQQPNDETSRTQP